ncbi:uncharacterized protein LOC135391862 isoform X2 [Ornithodoros turicata]|uniref:uncharacterized protein LOC135391862 isoform X2 n=1 Tax=Ornithodoros turicata TaxID=34597 RepID=UPI003138B612
MTSGEDFPTVHAGFSSHGTGAGEELQSAARTSLQKLLHGGWRRTSELLHPVSAEKRPSDATGQDNNEHPDGNDNYSCVGQYNVLFCKRCELTTATATAAQTTTTITTTTTVITAPSATRQYGGSTRANKS